MKILFFAIGYIAIATITAVTIKVIEEDDDSDFSIAGAIFWPLLLLVAAFIVPICGMDMLAEKIYGKIKIANPNINSDNVIDMRSQINRPSTECSSQCPNDVRGRNEECGNDNRTP